PVADLAAARGPCGHCAFRDGRRRALLPFLLTDARRASCGHAHVYRGSRRLWTTAGSAGNPRDLDGSFGDLRRLWQRAAVHHRARNVRRHSDVRVDTAGDAWQLVFSWRSSVFSPSVLSETETDQ